jgi:hypothetical protein
MAHMPIAALVYSPEADPEAVLAEVVRLLQARGVALAGGIEHNSGVCSSEMELLPSGVRMSISQDLGSGASGCRLDTTALAEAASAMRRAIEASPSLAVFNKFGGQEAAGGGLRDEMAAAVMAGVPVLTMVGERFMTQWLEFTGGDSVQLPCSVEAALDWWDSLSAT